MAHYVMGDIHGEADRFHAMLKKIQFSEDDILILLGDVIDRGPDVIALLLEIMEMPNAIMLLGNHEYMMLQYLGPDATDIEIRRWNKNGNAPTLAAYLKQKEKVQQRIIAYLRSITTHLDIEVAGKRFYMVHGFPGDNVHDEVCDETDNGVREPDPGLQADHWTYASAKLDSTGREKNKSCTRPGEQGRTP